MEYNIEQIEINETEKDTHVVITGWSVKDGVVPALTLFVNGEETDFIKITQIRDDIVKSHSFDQKLRVCGFQIILNHIQAIKSLSLRCGSETLLSLNEEDINTRNTTKSVYCEVENVAPSADGLVTTVVGYAYSQSGNNLSFSIQNQNHQSVSFQKRNLFRKDLIDLFGVEEEHCDFGFFITFSSKKDETYVLSISDGKETVENSLSFEKTKSNSHLVKSIVNNLNVKTIKVGLNYLRFFGLKNTINRIRTGRYRASNYTDWFLTHRATPEELEKERDTVFAYSPKISMIVPTYNTPVDLLEEMVESVIAQTYSNWELCIADGSDENHPARKKYLEYAKEDPRIKVKLLDQNYGISGNTNQALSIATGEYTGLYDHDDFLEPNALFEIVKVLNENKYDVIYTDEDKFQNKQKLFVDGNMKPDFSIDLLRSHNYITHLFVVRTDILKSVGGFDSKYDGSQDYDVVFKCVEQAKNGIYHLPKVLYHWRVHEGSTADDPESKLYCFEAGEHAIQAHLDRLGIDAKAYMLTKPYYGLYHVVYSTKQNPLVSIIIPNYEAKDVLQRCLDSIFAKNTYRNIEIIIVENNSKSQEIFDYYEQIQRQHDNVHVVTWKGTEFNFSAINNYGVQFAKGDYLLFLNNDTEIIENDAISEMVGHCMREEVGVVGAKLLYPNKQIQHAGVIVGLSGVAGHVFSRVSYNDVGYYMRPLVNVDYSAVTAACMMTKKSLFEEVGGFEESFKVAFNDIDYCLKIRKLNKLVVYDAYSLWYHYESVTRGYEESEEKRIRFESEVQLFQNRWRDILVHGDPYYNPNFDMNYTPFKVR